MPPSNRVPLCWLDDTDTPNMPLSNLDSKFKLLKNGDWRDNLLTKLTIRNTYEHDTVDKLSVTYHNDVIF